MAINKTTSSKAIIRKVFRDLNPSSDNWIEDAIEWIGEALEHIGAAAQLEKKLCLVHINDFKGVLPADLYYVNQVSVNSSVNPSIATELDDLLAKVDDIYYLLENNPAQDLTYQLRDFNSRILVLENIYTSAETGLVPLSYCTTNFPQNIDCPNCSNTLTNYRDCYYLESDWVKTSFQKGKVCLSYMAFPTDDEGYPLVPDDISFKEAMFWYIHKKILLSGESITNNGVDYLFADQQWKYYCTQARNAANYPDIGRMESFMNQWVRLIPNINRYDEGFDTLGARENLYRGRYNSFNVQSWPESMRTGGGTPSTGPKAESAVRRVSLAVWEANTNATVQNVITNDPIPLQLNSPLSTDVTLTPGNATIAVGTNNWVLGNMNAGNTLQFTFNITGTGSGVSTGDVVVKITLTNTSNNTDYTIGEYYYNNAQGATSFAGVVTYINTNIASATLKVEIQSATTQITNVVITSGNIRIQ